MANEQPIFLVENDASMILAIQRLLRAAGFYVVAFSSAEDLLTSGGNAAACYVLDVDLPGLSGFELWRRLLETGVDRPVIFITARDEPSTHDAALRFGAVACLIKPFRGESFLAAIREAMERPDSDTPGRSDSRPHHSGSLTH